MDYQQNYHVRITVFVRCSFELALDPPITVMQNLHKGPVDSEFLPIRVTNSSLPSIVLGLIVREFASDSILEHDSHIHVITSSLKRDKT